MEHDMIGKHENAIRDSYQAVALALELLADIHRDDPSAMCIECARRSASSLYRNALQASFKPGADNG